MLPKKLVLFFSILFVLFILVFPKSFAEAATPVLFFSDLIDGPKTGWEGSTTKGAAVTIWGKNFGSSRGSSYVTVGGVNLTNDSDYAEWSATTNPTTARGLERITFWLNSTMSNGATTIKVTTSEGETNTIDFYCRALGSNHIYFISRSGNNNNNGLYSAQGSGTNGPWFSANKVRTLQAGDVCYFRTGIWNEEDDWSAVIDFWAVNHGNGTINNSITIASYPGEVAQLGDSSIQIVIRHHGSAKPDILSYWTFSKFTMRSNSGTTNWGLSAPGSDDHNRFIGNDISTTYGGSSALHLDGQLGGSTYLYIYGNYIHDCGTDTRGQTSPNRAYPLYFTGYGFQDYIYVGWNELAYNENGRGMQVYGHQATDTMDHLYIHDNYIHNNGLTGSILGGGDGGTYKFIINLYYYNNIVADNGLRVSEHGGYPGIKIDSMVEGNWFIYNNIFYHNRNHEISISAGAVEPESTIFKNNIIIPYSGKTYFTGDSGAYLSGSNNCFYSAGSGPSWDTSKVETDPLFVVDPPTSDLHFQLKETSPCKDAGTATVSDIVGIDYLGISKLMGAGYDIGAYEYVSSQQQYHPADLNQNNRIEMRELVAFIGRWKIGQTTLVDVLEVLGRWMSGNL